MHKRSLLIALRPAFLLIVFACASAAHAEHGVEHWLGIAKMLAPAGSAIDFTPHATQPGLVYDIQPPEPQCTACHGGNAGGDPADASTYRPFSTWSGSMMANATRDPLFFAALDIANHDMPGVGDYCLRCHTPRGWLMGRVVKPGFGPPERSGERRRGMSSRRHLRRAGRHQQRHGRRHLPFLPSPDGDGSGRRARIHGQRQCVGR